MKSKKNSNSNQPRNDSSFLQMAAAHLFPRRQSPNQEIKIFYSTLPEDIDWDEISNFMRETMFYKHLLLNRWRELDAFTVYPISDTSIECIRCLHEDLSSCYNHIFAVDENGNEDRHEEYRILREKLNSKYAGMDEYILTRIYDRYLMEDR